MTPDSSAPIARFESVLKRLTTRSDEKEERRKEREKEREADSKIQSETLECLKAMKASQELQTANLAALSTSLSAQANVLMELLKRSNH